MADPAPKRFTGHRAPAPMKVERQKWGDIHRGTRDQLIAAGLAAEGEFPGDPGRPKHSVRYASNGQQCPPRVSRTSFDGTREILRVSKTRYELRLRVGEEEKARREKLRAQQEESDPFLDALGTIANRIGLDVARAHLDRLHRKARPLHNRAGLRLVWSSGGTSQALPLEAAHG